MPRPMPMRTFMRAIVHVDGVGSRPGVSGAASSRCRGRGVPAQGEADDDDGDQDDDGRARRATAWTTIATTAATTLTSSPRRTVDGADAVARRADGGAGRRCRCIVVFILGSSLPTGVDSEVHRHVRRRSPAKSASRRRLRSAAMTTHALDPLALFRLDGKVAIVTGASSGLGDRFARVLDAVGAQVVARGPAGRPAGGAGRRPRRTPSWCRPTCPTPTTASASSPTTLDTLRAPRRAGQQRRHRRQGRAGGRGARLVPGDDGDQRHGAVAPLQAVADGARSPTAAAASSTSRRCSATSASTPVKQASYCASKGAVVNLTRELALQFARRKCGSTPCARAGSRRR